MDNKKIEQFWADIAQQCIGWFTPWHTTLSGNFTKANTQWFCGGKLNVSVNCLDRHLPSKSNYPALIWQGEEQEKSLTYTFFQLHQEVGRMANSLKKLAIKKGDVVAIYLPLIPEALISMLACTRIGAVHTVVFAGFSPHALQQRLLSSKAKLLITADGYQRTGKYFNLKQQADAGCEQLNIPQLVIQHSGKPCSFSTLNNYWWHEIRSTVSADCAPEKMDAEDPLFILYTSGSTGEPKGL